MGYALTKVEADPDRYSAVDQLIRWRFSQLRRSGYPEPVAAEIAARFDIDLHEATGLVQAGCPPATAVRILF